MVKNFGGNKNKKFGRKHMAQSNNRKLRIKQDDDEMYACVTKMLGNGMCNIVGIDEVNRLCIIRNKFRGRSKRQNMLNPGSWVLIGLRSWQTKQENSNKLETCDLLEVYNPNEVNQLKSDYDEKWDVFRGIGNIHLQHIEHEDMSEYGFEMGDSNDVDDETKERIENEIECDYNDTNKFVMDNEVINIDDI